MQTIEVRRDGPEVVSGLTTENIPDHGEWAMAVKAAVWDGAGGGTVDPTKVPRETVEPSNHHQG